MSKSKNQPETPVTRERRTPTGKAWDHLLALIESDDPWASMKLGDAAFKLARAVKIHEIAKEIEQEYASARAKHAPMRGAHEGYAVLKEEVDELWDEIKAQVPDRAKMRAEALQVAAMALAFVAEVCA